MNSTRAELLMVFVHPYIATEQREGMLWGKTI